MSSADAAPGGLAGAGPGLDDFESLAVDVESFDHAAHLYVAWQYVRRYDLPEAISRCCRTLRQLTAAAGVPGKYHETVTWFFMILVAERVRRKPDHDWPAFRAANGDLFERRPGIIQRYYSPETLNAEAARRQFVLPAPGIARTGRG